MIGSKSLSSLMVGYLPGWKKENEREKEREREMRGRTNGRGGRERGNGNFNERRKTAKSWREKN